MEEQTNGFSNNCEGKIMFTNGSKNDSIFSELLAKSNQWSENIDSAEFAKKLDEEDPLRKYRKLFYYPKRKDVEGKDSQNEECIYLCGQSLGLQLKSMKSKVLDTLDNWAQNGSECHFTGEYPGIFCDQVIKEKMAILVGAETNEIAFMNGLSVNIHIMMASFYNPTTERYKILMIDSGFHSDWYALKSHVALRGFDPDESIIFVKPKESKHLIEAEDILSLIETEGESISLLFIEGVHYYTGQLFDLKRITEAGHKQGCIVGYDLAHAAGNVKLQLHDWNVDFAVWCTYKYLNSGPGGMGAIFCHSKHTKDADQIIPKLRAWWGLDCRRKFAFDKEFTPAEGADRFKMSNPSPVLCAMISNSLDVFIEAGMNNIQEKQRLITGYLEYLLKKNLPISCFKDTNTINLQIVTPPNPKERGSQLSLLSSVPVSKCEMMLKKEGVVCDIRYPSVIRITPAPLYNTFLEVYKFVHVLKKIWETMQIEESPEN